MKIYHYDPETLEYTGESFADPSPLEPGEWLVPAHATKIEPQVIANDNQIMVFENNIWLLKDKPEEFIEIFEDNMLPYQRNRWAEYPSIGDQLDALYHAGVFPEEMANKIKEVKDKYPKSE